MLATEGWGKAGSLSFEVYTLPPSRITWDGQLALYTFDNHLLLVPESCTGYGDGKPVRRRLCSVTSGVVSAWCNTC